MDKDINANLSKLPADVLILKVDYDNSSELKKKYSVLGQHTLVQVDKDGNMKSTWRGSATVSKLLENSSKYHCVLFGKTSILERALLGRLQNNFKNYGTLFLCIFIPGW